MDPTTLDGDLRLDEAAMVEVSTALAAVYEELCEEPAIDSHASLAGNLLAWVFEDGLAPVDLGLLAHGKVEELRRFRLDLLDTIGDRFRSAVEATTGAPVTYSFFGFDPGSNTTRGVFLLDLLAPERERREGLILSSRRLRSSSRRLRSEHVMARKALRATTERLRRNHDLYRLEREVRVRSRRVTGDL